MHDDLVARLQTLIDHTDSLVDDPSQPHAIGRVSQVLQDTLLLIRDLHIPAPAGGPEWVGPAGADGRGVAQSDLLMGEPFDVLVQFPVEPLAVAVLHECSWTYLSAGVWELSGTLDLRVNHPGSADRMEAADTVLLRYLDGTSEQLSDGWVFETSADGRTRVRIGTQRRDAAPDGTRRRTATPRYTRLLAGGVSICESCTCCVGTYQNYRDQWLCAECADHGECPRQQAAKPLNDKIQVRVDLLVSRVNGYIEGAVREAARIGRQHTGEDRG